MCDGSVYDATLEKMRRMPELLRILNSTVVQSGALLIRPLEQWTQPPDTSKLVTSVKTSKQQFPHSPHAEATKSRSGDSVRTPQTVGRTRVVLSKMMFLVKRREQSCDLF